MKKDILARFEKMKYDAKERHIKLSPGQLCVLVLADVVEDQLKEIDKSLVVINNNR